jgi:hypothetical protein
MRYRRADVPDGTYFFIINLEERKRTLLVDHIDALRTVTRMMKTRHPFRIDAMVILPDHLDAVWGKSKIGQIMACHSPSISRHAFHGRVASAAEDGGAVLRQVSAARFGRRVLGDHRCGSSRSRDGEAVAGFAHLATVTIGLLQPALANDFEKGYEANAFY